MISIEEIREKAIHDPAVNVILSDGGQECFRRPEKTRRILVHSVAKSVTALGFGIAMQEGLVSLEETLKDAFAESMPKVLEAYEASRGSDEAKIQADRFKDVRLKHLLSNTSGFRDNFLTGFERPFLKEDDWVSLCLMNPLVQKPGKEFLYCDANYYLIAKLLQKRAGQTLSAYLLPRLFEPLGLHYPSWEADPQGDAVGCGGLLLCLDELHVLGKLCLQNGIHGEKAIVPSDWMRTALTEKIPFGDGCGYGYGFWTAPDCAYMFGLGGIYNFLSKSGDLLITADGLSL